jgi:hypothetical protein
LTITINVADELHISRMIGDFLPFERKAIKGYIFLGIFVAMANIAVCCRDAYRKDEDRTTQLAKN